MSDQWILVLEPDKNWFKDNTVRKIIRASGKVAESSDETPDSDCLVFWKHGNCVPIGSFPSEWNTDSLRAILIHPGNNELITCNRLKKLAKFLRREPGELTRKVFTFQHGRGAGQPELLIGCSVEDLKKAVDTPQDVKQVKTALDRLGRAVEKAQSDSRTEQEHLELNTKLKLNTKMLAEALASATAGHLRQKLAVSMLTFVLKAEAGSEDDLETLGTEARQDGRKLLFQEASDNSNCLEGAIEAWKELAVSGDDPGGPVLTKELLKLRDFFEDSEPVAEDPRNWARKVMAAADKITNILHEE